MRMLGDMIGEFKGQVTSVRVLPEGKMENSERASGNILGVDATWLATSISTPMPNGTIMAEGDAVITTIEGDVVMVKKSGIGLPAGKGRRTSRRGVFFHMTQSQKLDHLNRVVGVWEFESEEDGNWHVKIWVWR